MFAQVELIPYDHRNPVIFDQDGGIESGFLDVYIMALQSAGAIDLRGMISTGSYEEEKRRPPFSLLADEELVRERQELIDKARRSGFRNIPDATAGPSISLQSRRPTSGRIEDTAPIGTPGSRLIVEQARAASASQPLVIVMGGQATAVADAYLLDPTIVDRVIVAWQAGWLRTDGRVAAEGSFNMSVDPWASHIVMDRLRTVLFVGKGAADGGIPRTPKSRLTELPNTELRMLMTEAGWPRADGFWEPTMEIDGPPAIALTRSDYVMETRRYSLVGWEASPWDANILLPIYEANPGGDVLAVIRASEPVGTEEWWKRVTSAAAWGNSVGQVAYRSEPTGNARTRTALTGPPWPVPGRIEAEDFDQGGTGRSYRDSTNNFADARFNPVRFLEHVDIEASDTASGGFFVNEAVADEWVEYSLDVASNATYTIEVRVASSRGGGTFRIEIDGVNQTGSITVPDTGANQWTTISIPNVALSGGPHVARLIMESNGAGGEVGAFDSLRFSR